MHIGSALRQMMSRFDRLDQPFAKPTRQMGFLDPFDEGVGVQEVALDEFAQASADRIFAARNEGGVRDRDSERMAEQGSDCEPVSDPTDHGRLRRCPDVAGNPLTVAEEESGDEYNSGDDEQS